MVVIKTMVLPNLYIWEFAEKSGAIARTRTGGLLLQGHPRKGPPIYRKSHMPPISALNLPYISLTAS